MFSKHTHICSERYDLWIDNHFLGDAANLLI